jgi:hypothetical protein
MANHWLGLGGPIADFSRPEAYGCLRPCGTQAMTDPDAYQSSAERVIRQTP